MDDTTLISKNKEGLEKMIKICHEFFKINDIKANIGKYELIKINNNQDNLVIKGEEVKKVNSCEGNRYLGNLEYGDYTTYQISITGDLEAIAIPRIEYLTKHIFITHNILIHNPIYPYILNIWDSQLWMQASHFIQFLILTFQNRLWTNDISETDNNPLLITHQTTIQEFKEGINSIQLY
ncbi:hypothetical protein RhiirC2_853935 [Rhizophagus irregularis]|uniref:Reverse transcriptase domain-containing protein n=1 Tax=Rhizophagus irregularis TaxID=588596 RepID=A0A2N1MTI7_9GLOM|nr:hypothetical protein RhiirC2_853935 [Rhizophagus irregularis]